MLRRFFEEFVSVSNELLMAQEKLGSKTSELESEVNTLGEKVFHKGEAIIKSSEFFDGAEERLQQLRARCSVFSELLDGASDYIDSMAAGTQSSTSWGDINKLRNQLCGKEQDEEE